ncbi:MAG: regulatory protein RecX [Spirochaetes bacterium]|nr:regulatory protein RecX [Spirochaetota bacterium]
MITISKIRHGNDCVTLELDNGELLKIPLAVTGLYGLETGRSIDATEYAQLSVESQRYRCKAMALNYLAICPRSALEMERYLGKKKFDRDIIREIVNAITRAGYIDDADYAARYIENKLRKKLVGKQLLARELQKKGISRQIINHALKETETIHTDPEALYAIAQKKYAAVKDKKNSIAKLSYFLHSRGFDTEMVRTVTERILKENEDRE